MRYNPYYSQRELKEIGFKSLGEKVLVSRTCRIYTPEQITLGSHVIIDDFTILNGNVNVGDHVHISSFCECYTGLTSSVTLGDFTGISSHVSFYAKSDDYIGATLNNPTVAPKYKGETEADIVLGKYVLVGTHSVVLLGVNLGDGCAFGSACVINRDTPPAGVYVGAPCRRIRERDLEGIRRMEQQLREEERLRVERRARRMSQGK